MTLLSHHAAGPFAGTTFSCALQAKTFAELKTVLTADLIQLSKSHRRCRLSWSNLSMTVCGCSISAIVEFHEICQLSWMRSGWNKSRSLWWLTGRALSYKEHITIDEDGCHLPRHRWPVHHGALVHPPSVFRYSVAEYCSPILARYWLVYKEHIPIDEDGCHGRNCHLPRQRWPVHHGALVHPPSVFRYSVAEYCSPILARYWLVLTANWIISCNWYLVHYELWPTQLP